MHAASGHWWWERAVLWRVYFVLLMIALVAVSAAGTVVYHDGYSLLDWVITYDGGFVRRGVLGTLMREVSETTGLLLSVQVFALVLACYAVIVWGFARLFALSGYDSGFAMLALAPFFINFPVAEPLFAAGRKEVLLLAAFTLLCLAVARRHQPGQIELPSSRPFIWFMLVMPVMILAHEGLVFFIGFVVLLGVLNGVKPMLLSVLTLPSLAAATAAAMSPGDAARVSAICSGIAPWLGSQTLAVECVGPPHNAVTWLKSTAGDAVALFLHDATAALPRLPLALALIAMAFWPLRHMIRHLPAPVLRVLVRGLSLSWLMLVPLMVLGIDWGRFLMVASSLTILILLSLRLQHRDCGDTGKAPHPLVIAIFAMGWRLNFVGPLVGLGRLLS